MPKAYSMSAEQRAEIEAQKKNARDVRVYRKLEVLSLRANGKKNGEIAAITGYSKHRVNHLVSEYCRNGIGYFLEEHRKGGNHRNLKREEETAFLSPFLEKAEAGQQLTMNEIYQAYLDLKPNAHKSTVYNLIHRHGWRKVMPRPKHPKAGNEEAQDASKKLSIGTKKNVMNYLI